MHILVTGGSGFIGTNFIRYYLEKHPQDQITNLDKLTYAANPKGLKEYENNPRYHFIKGDICDQALVQKIFKDSKEKNKKIDVIVHFAAESHVDRSLADPTLFLRTNILGTYNLLQTALDHSINRFHHVSTDEVFGSVDRADPSDTFTEDRAYQPSSPYSASKAASDHLVRSFQHSFGLPTTISNCSNNYGPYQNPEKFIPRIITNLILGKNIPIYGQGLNIRDWLHVSDHCQAIDLILNKGRIGETYCIGGLTKDVSNLDLVKKILKAMNLPESRIEFVPDRPGHDDYRVSFQKIHQDLGWQPTYSLEKGLTQTIAWYQKNPAWWQKSKEEAESFYQKLTLKQKTKKLKK